MIRIGLIGAGRMGRNHSNHLAKMKNVILRGVYDLNPEKAESYRKDFGAEIFPNPAALVASPEVDFIMICSPTYAHIEGLVAAMPTQKPVFCEKPLCRTESELGVLAPMIRNYKSFFALGFVRRYSAASRKMKELFDSGIIGNPLCGDIKVLHGSYIRMPGDWFADYQLCGGVMLDMLAHHIDLQNMFLGKKPKRIFAGALMLDKKLEKPCDFVSATAVYDDGFISNLECTWMRSGPGGNSMTIYGEKGALTLSDSDGLTLHTPGKNEKIPCEDHRLFPELNPNDDFYYSEMLGLIDAVENHQSTTVSADDAVNAMEFCLAMMKSAETKQIVEL